MLKAYKYRIYPNKSQEELIQKTFGCCRFVYNQILSYRKELYERQSKNITKFDCVNYVNRVLKSEYTWLKEVDKFSLTNSVNNMDDAYRKFFKGIAKFPKFKNKHDMKKSYTTNCIYHKNQVPSIEILFENNKLKLPKLSWLKTNISKKFEGKIKSVTVSQVPSGKYYVSVLVETEQPQLPKTDKAIGIDLGIKDLVITSDGDKFDNLKLIKKYEDKLAREQRKLAHKKKGGKNSG